MACYSDATQQHVWCDLFGRGEFRISAPLCQDCSEEDQPAETTNVLSLDPDFDLACQCGGCDACYDGDPPDKDDEAPAPASKVPDLMAALEDSLAEAKAARQAADVGGATRDGDR